jgi:hypothetical protein
MADTKITALDAIGANPINVATFPIPMVDLLDNSMAASGTTKKVTVNQILGAGGTATLASATITGDLTVDTSTLKVDSANDRVGIGIATPAWPLDIRSATAVAQILSTTGTNAAYLQVSNTGGIFYLGRENSAGTSFASPAYSAVLYAGGAYPLVTTVNGSERYRIASDGVATWSNVGGVAGTAMTLNSTGLGVGASPSYKLSVAGTANIGTIGTAGRSLLIASSAADNITIEQTNNGSGSHTFDIKTPGWSTDSFNVYSGSTNRLKLTGDGNLGIGVTPSAWNTFKAIQHPALSLASYSTTEAYYSQNAYNDGTWRRVAAGYASQYIQVNSEHRFLTAGTSSAGSSITFTQAMTLDASGNLLVGKTANYGTGETQTLQLKSSVVFASDNTGSASNRNWSIGTNASAAGNMEWTISSTNTGWPNFAYRLQLTSAGDVNNTTGTYGTISDLRLKENISDARNYLADLLKLRVVKYSLKEEASAVATKLGFIAQEVEQVFPNLVDQSDKEYEGAEGIRSVKTSILIPMLLKAIQELTARVQTLEAR